MCIRDRRQVRAVEHALDVHPGDQLVPGEAELGERAHREEPGVVAVSYTHLRAHETVLDLVCRLLLEKKNKITMRRHTM